MTYNQLSKKQKVFLSKVHRHIALKNEKIFTARQLDKLIELVSCSYIYNLDMKTGDGNEQRLLANIYFILTGYENPERER